MKRILYIVSFAVLGLLVGFLIEAIGEIFYINLLVNDFDRYSFTLPYSSLLTIRVIFGTVLVGGFAIWGTFLGFYFWRRIYVEKAYSRWSKRKHRKKFGVLAVLLILTIAFLLIDKNNRVEDSLIVSPNIMKIESRAFDSGERIPAKYSCEGENISPPLTISEVPEGALSLALIMDDPDVPRALVSGGVFDHWIVWDIPPFTTQITEGVPPIGFVGPNSKGESNYTGPCPPDREHRYFFKLFALDKTLADDTITSRKDLEKAMEGHILDAAELMGTYPQAKR